MLTLSIITINYNNQAGLQKTIDSVINQTTKGFDFIVIDGNSNDGSKNIIEQYKDKITYYVSEPDTGIYNAMNKGISKANGEYLLFLNSGDWLFDNNVVASLQPYLCDTDVISGDINLYHDNKWHLIKSQDIITIDYFLAISLYHQATFVKKELFTKSGLYDERFKMCGDYEFFIRTLLKEDATYKHIPVVVSNFITDGISNSDAYKAINFKEREMAWSQHFSKLVYKHFEISKSIYGSKELKWGNRFFRFFPFAKYLDKWITKVWY